MSNLVPHELISLVFEEALSTEKTRMGMLSATGAVAVAKCASNRGAARYQMFKQFLDSMTPEQRVTLCTLVEEEIKLYKRRRLT